jgi:hypothetical protein
MLLFGAAVHPQYALPGPTLSSSAKAGQVKCSTQTVQKFRPFASKVWALEKWERGKPKKGSPAIKAQRKRLKCARSVRHLRAMQRTWKKRQRAFFKHRREQLANWCAPNPHPDGDGCWVIPGWCVFAESGGSWTAHNPSSPARGPYQLLSHGEPWPVSTRAQAMEHHRIAASLYAAGGLGPWVAC